MADQDGQTMLNRAMARAAGAVCLALALAAAAALAGLTFAWRDRGGQVLAHLGGWIVLLALMAAASGKVFRLNASAQRLLLVFWLAVAVAAVAVILAGQLWGTDWWGLPVPLAAAAGAALAAGVVAAALLVAASAERSPLRYSSYVTVSLAAAVGLAVAVNMIAQDLYARRDMQQLGRYGLSQRSRKILATVKSPVRLTCVYTSSDERAKASDYRPAVLDLLTDMHENNPNIEVASATSDSAKARIIARLRQQAGSKADQHVQFLEEFCRRGDELSAALAQERAAWEQLGDRSYPAMWAMTAEVAGLLQQADQAVRDNHNTVTRELHGAGLPDYAGLTERVTSTLTGIRQHLQEDAKLLADIAEIPQAAAKNRTQAAEKLQALRKSVSHLRDVMAGGASGRGLEESAAAARDAAQRATEAARAFENLAGSDKARLVAASAPLQLAIPRGMLEVRSNVPQFLEQYAGGGLGAMAEAIEAIGKVARPEYYAQSMEKMRGELAELSAVVDQVLPVAEEALNKLSQVDQPSGRILDLARQGKLFEQATSAITPLIEQAEKLPTLKSDALPAEVASENIVIVETGGKASVVGFDEVWPLTVARRGEGQAEGQGQRRVFNGDSAIASRILSMTTEPFATVVLTYYQPPQEAARATLRPDIAPADLSTLSKRLEEANFEVVEWDLSEDRPAVTGSRPQVLLVLPPPPSLPAATGGTDGFGKQHLDKVVHAIDAGTPAIFLTQFLWPRQMLFAPPISPEYPYADYLQADWGIEVKSDCLVIPAVADESQPGRFRFAPVRFRYTPLSAFTDQPIGRPLQAQRVLWTDMAPILIAQDRPQGITVEPVLTVPTSWRSTWATKRLGDLQAQLDTENQNIHPDYQAGDIAPPFHLALAAARGGQPTTASAPSSLPASAPTACPARIVVTTLGASLVDGYLDQFVGQIDSGGALSLTDPPRANADLIINSIQWLIGREALIAAGPAQTKPVAMISETTMDILRAAYLIVLPLAVVAAGMLVMLARRR